MKTKKTNGIKYMFEVKEYDTKTLEIVYSIFDKVVQECIDYCQCDLGLDVPEDVEVKLYNSDEYREFLDSLSFYKGPESMMTYGSGYTINDKRDVFIHGCESNIGITNWLHEFRQFETLVNNIMSQVMSEGSREYIIHDKDFAKEQFEIVQAMLNKKSA